MDKVNAKRKSDFGSRRAKRANYCLPLSAQMEVKNKAKERSISLTKWKKKEKKKHMREIEDIK